MECPSGHDRVVRETDRPLVEAGAWILVMLSPAILYLPFWLVRVLPAWAAALATGLVFVAFLVWLHRSWERAKRSWFCKRCKARWVGRA